MLFHRILTAIPLALIVIWLILFQPTSSVLYALLLIAAIAGYEWAHLAGISTVLLRGVFSVLILAITWFLLYELEQYVHVLISAVALFWLFLGFYLFTIEPKHKGTVLSPVKLMIGMLIIPVAMLAISQIHAQDDGPHWLLFALMIVWVADIGAYFSGRRFGKKKLARHISPGKTVEGVYGAVIATLIFASAASYFFSLNTVSTCMLLVLSLVMTLISIVGDLYESVLKREAGMKDSGAILPGHGGILDRIDSVLAAMPLFYAGFYWLLLPLVEH